jgi:hypothetical protein
MNRHTIGISGCTNAFDVVASTSSFVVASARSFELLIVAGGLEKLVTHKTTSFKETLDLMHETHRGSCLGKSMVTISNVSTSFQKNT